MTIEQFLRQLKPHDRIIIETPDEEYRLEIWCTGTGEIGAFVFKKDPWSLKHNGYHCTTTRTLFVTSGEFIAWLKELGMHCGCLDADDWEVYKTRAELKAENAALKRGRTAPIKFRGEAEGGRQVYGYYVPWSRESRSGVFTVKEKVAGNAGILTDGGDLVGVKAGTIKQLIGYDSDGREVYEGRREAGGN